MIKVLLLSLAVGDARRNKKMMGKASVDAVHNHTEGQPGYYGGGANYYAYDNSKEGFVTTNYDVKYKSSTGHCKLVAGCTQEEPVLPILKGDCNPIGIGNIHGAYGLFVEIFGSEPRRRNRRGRRTKTSGEKRLSVSDLTRLVIERRFPLSYSYGGELMGNPLQVSPVSSRTQNLQTATRFAEPTAENVFLIICPFLSTLVNEGVLPLQQAYSRQLLEEVTIEAGLEFEAAEEHIAENFANRGDGETIGEEDLFNLEGAQNEHQQSTGINDCTTEFVECVDKTNSFGIGTVERPFESCVFVRSDCQLPRKDILKELVRVVDTNKDDFFTVDELNEAAKRSCTFDKPSAR